MNLNYLISISINSTSELICHCQDLKKYLHLNLKESAILTRNLIFIIFSFLQFLSSKFIFFKLNKIWNIKMSYGKSFLVLVFFKNFDVDFWSLLKTEKVFSPSRFWQENSFLQNFIFYHPDESINFYSAGLFSI